MKSKKDKIVNLILIIIPFACILLIWQIGSLFTNEFILPSVGETFTALLSVFAKSKFYVALLGTLLRTLIAFVISFVLAFILAFLTRINQKAEVVISTVISVLRALPTIAVVLILLLWTSSNVAAVVVTSLVVLPTTYSSLKDALFSVDDDLIKVLKLYGVDDKKLLKDVYTPAILPSTLLAIGNGLSLNLKLMVAAEVIAATANSIGYLLNSAKVNFEMPTMIAIVIVTVFIGILVEWSFQALSKKVGEWQ